MTAEHVEAAAVPSFEVATGSPYSWLSEMAPAVRELLLTEGAVLLRGLPLDAPHELGEVRAGLGFGGFTQTEAFNRRTDFGNGILSPISWPQERHICPLQEGSFSQTFPSVVLTGCVTPPDEGWGCIADARRIAGHLPTDLAERVRAGGWTMTRTFHRGIGVSWKEAFAVPDREALESLLEDEEIIYEWLPGGLLRTERKRPGFLSHPVTGQECWFNQLSFLNAGSLDPAERAFMTRAFGEHLPMNSFFGDGAPLSEGDVAAIDKAYDAVRENISWRSGDVLITDNVSMAVGRSAYTGSADFIVALGER